MSQMGQNGQMRGADARQLQQTLERLQQALQDMQQAGSSQQAGTPQGEAQARRAADRLREAQQMLEGLRGKQSTNQVDDLAKQAEDLARRQQESMNQLRQTLESQGDRGLNRQQAEQIAGQKDSEIADLNRLEQGLQNAVRDLMATQRQTSNKLREALGEMQQQEIPRDLQRNATWIRNGMGDYALMSEFQVTQGLNSLRDQLRQAQQSLASGSKDGQQDDKALEQALNNVERMRQALQALQQGQHGQQGGQPGQQQGQLQRGQQQGQQGGQQQGQGQQSQQGGQQQGGQQQGGQQQGGQQQGGQQQGGQQQGGQQAGGRQGGTWQPGQPGGPGGGSDLWNGGNWGGAYPWDPRNPIRPEDYQTAYRDAIQSLNQLQQQLRDDPNAVRDIQGVIRDLRQFDPFHYSNDSLLGERIQAALAGVEQVEMELRRKVDTTAGGSVRSPGTEQVPQGYEESVADYFRKLSKGK